MQKQSNLGCLKETKVNFPISESQLEITGNLRGDYSLPLAVLAPGLGGWENDLLLFNASRFLGQLGIATLRVSFYGDGEKQRNIRDFDVKTNASDIDAVVDYVKEQGSRWVCVIGHIIVE
jgi:alpha/beta superfamily hydrolase